MLSTVGIDLVGAIVLLVILTLRTGKVCANLRTAASPISDLNLGNLGANLYNSANNLVSYAEGKGNILSPSTSDGVNIRRANTAGVNGDIDIVLLKLLEREL